MSKIMKERKVLICLKELEYGKVQIEGHAKNISFSSYKQYGANKCLLIRGQY